MATNSDRIEFQRSAGALTPVAFPRFPTLPDRIKRKFPDLLSEWQQYDRDTHEFVVELQNIMRFGTGSVQLQAIVTPPVVFPPVPPGPQGGAQGSQGAQGKVGVQGPQGEPGDTVIVPPPPVNTDDEALVLATVGV